MGFWGIEVKPGKPYPYHSDNVPGRLHVTQATLGLGSSSERSIVQCSIGHKGPIFLCSLLPNKNESCPLNLEFEEDDLVAFSVIGPRSVHLTGFFESHEEEGIRDDYESDSFGEDIADTETDSSEFDNSDDYDDEFIDDDDDLELYPPSPVPNSGVVIEEIVDDEKPTTKIGQSKQQKKKNQSSGSEDNRDSQQQIIVRRDTAIPVLESEDEDGFPVSNKHESKSNVQKPEVEVKQTEDKVEKTNKKTQDGDSATLLKRKVENIDQEGRPEKKKKKKKNKQLNEKIGEENSDEAQLEELKSSKVSQVSPKMDDHEEKLANEKSPVTKKEKKKKKKKNKNKSQDNDEGETHAGQTVSAREDQNVSTLDLDKQTDAKSSKVRTYPNGLVVEELAMGKPDGKRAVSGKQVSVRYIGKLKKNGKIFDSNVGRHPFKFRLGVGQVIPGWDVGVNGMRVGDKRRLTIPPEMGYGSKGAGGAIPPNAWLLFDVELVDVR
ncbi:Peptidyl-prolyl cis-trans isomerase, FKBP-type [Trema orientale]|uniref:peptidylprolyl isomerase n=1 Tax=Trema orientale TaxID=63057 RepID=A0A2P5CFY5_TREOI|nr:Peptidyl-prolyl cis-trans isomerase, FKBP-type [Trema orientale]